MDTSKLETVKLTKTEPAAADIDEELSREIAGYAGVSTRDSSAILSAALPLLLGNLSGSNQNNTLGLLSGLMGTAAEEEDEEEIEAADAANNSVLSALFGGKKNTTNGLAQIAQSLGLDAKTVSKVLIAAAPFLLKKVMSLVSTDTSAQTTTSSSKKKKKKTESASEDALSSLLGGLLGAEEEEEKPSSSKKKKKTSKKEEEENDLMGDLAGALLQSLLSKK